MKRKWILPLTILIIVALAGSAVALYPPLQTTGLIHSAPGDQGVFSVASGVYIGQGYVLTNWHVMNNPQFRQAFFQLPLWNPHVYNFDIPIAQLIYSEQRIDLAIVRLEPSALGWFRTATPCLSSDPLQIGQVLTVTSSPEGRYPPVSATVVVIDAQPQLRLDPDPQVPESERYAAISIVTQVLPGQEGMITYGSSGGAVVNSEGELVGLIWTGRYLPDGTQEQWFTPVSAWFAYLEQSSLVDDSPFVLESRCEYR